MKDLPLFKPRSSDQAANKQKFNRKATVFAICLCIASFFWVITTLSMPFPSLLKFPVKYVNLPKDKLISNNLPDSLELDIKASGFEILRCRMKQHLDPIVIDASSYRPHKNSGYYFITTNTKLDNISRQIGNGLKILSIIPDTIFLNFSRKASKIVPVKANVELSFRKEYQQSDSIVIFPKEIRISGSPALLDKVKELHTQDVVLKDLDKSVTLRKAVLINSEFKQLELASDSVSIKVPVAKFTEGEVSVALEMLHVPPGTSLKVFPDKIKITYLVSFDSFEKVKPEMFRAVIDYAKLEEGSTKIKVDMVRVPTFIRSVMLNPDRVEYIVRK
ncbi:MAG TPA: CdaR family protein [Bacteroidia bacterium]|nr:CdaR family protein [Bacteroidia bacterium]